MLKKILKLAFVAAVIFSIEHLILGIWNFSGVRGSGAPGYASNEFSSGIKVAGPRVLAEEEEKKTDLGVSYSEDFRIEQVTIGEGMGSQIYGVEDTSPLRVYGISSRILSVKDEPDKTEAVISWKTSRACRGSVEYSKKGGGNVKTVEEDNFSTAHTLILTDLEPDSVYEYVLISRDTLGAEQRSDPYVAYTGAPNTSLVDVLQGAAQKVFGWAIK